MKRILVMLCAVVLVLNANAQDDCMNPDVNCDGYVTVNDLLGLLGYYGDEDLDGDGVWDSQDDCVLDICGVCGGEGIDLDEDGVCDEWDDCVGEFDECGVCNGNGPEVLAVDTITFTVDSIFVEAINEWYVFEVPDTTFTFVCTNPGCTDPTADNFDPYASEDDGSCIGGDPCANELTVTFDGYTYDLVAIGDQCWFAENLRTEHYANGDAIPSALSNDEWSSTTSGATAVYDENASNLETYGRLYNCYAGNDPRGLCPSGWHVPTSGEWTVMTDHLGGSSVAGAAMKSSATDMPAWNGTNSSGFSGLPGGRRVYNSGSFSNAGGYGFWWSSSVNSNGQGSDRHLSSAANVWGTNNNQHWGFSVRCLKDAE